VILPEDPFVRELLPEFVDTWIQDINSQFDDLIKNQNSDELYRLGHTVKGSCLQFGLDDIAAFGIELMGYAKANDWQKAEPMKSILLNAFQEIRKIL